MNTTNVDSLAVVSIACLRSLHDSLLRATAMISAPLAPIAPPSVGVATPRKIVPSTRKISASGGDMHKGIRSASRRPRPDLLKRVINAAEQDAHGPRHGAV